MKSTIISYENERMKRTISPILGNRETLPVSYLLYLEPYSKANQHIVNIVNSIYHEMQSESI